MALVAQSGATEPAQLREQKLGRMVWVLAFNSQSEALTWTFGRHLTELPGKLPEIAVRFTPHRSARVGC